MSTNEEDIQIQLDRIKNIADEISITLSEIMPNRADEIRIKNMGAFDKFFNQIVEEFSNYVAKKQTTEARRIKSIEFNKDELKEKERLLLAINTVVYMASYFFASAELCIINAKEKVGACQEFATLAAIQLFMMVGIGDSSSLVIELARAEVINSPMMNHAFLIINRRKGSDLLDMSSWGEHCLVYDPQHNWITKPESIGEFSCLNAYYQQGESSGYRIKITANNLFSIGRITQYNKNHPLSTIAQISREALLSFDLAPKKRTLH